MPSAPSGSPAASSSRAPADDSGHRPPAADIGPHAAAADSAPSAPAARHYQAPLYVIPGDVDSNKFGHTGGLYRLEAVHNTADGDHRFYLAVRTQAGNVIFHLVDVLATFHTRPGHQYHGVNGLANPHEVLDLLNPTPYTIQVPDIDPLRARPSAGTNDDDESIHSDEIVSDADGPPDNPPVV